MAMGDDRSGAPVWDDSAVTRAEAAAFFARVIGSDSRYISHGEVQCGLSEDGKSWVGDLDARFAEDMAEDDPERDLLVMRARCSISATMIDPNPADRCAGSTAISSMIP